MINVFKTEKFLARLLPSKDIISSIPQYSWTTETIVGECVSILAAGQGQIPENEIFPPQKNGSWLKSRCCSICPLKGVNDL